MKKISMKDAVTVLAAGAILYLFEKQIRELYPDGVDALRVFDIVESEQFPTEAEFDSEGKEIIARLIGDIIEDLSELEKKYAE